MDRSLKLTCPCIDQIAYYCSDFLFFFKFYLTLIIQLRFLIITFYTYLNTNSAGIFFALLLFKDQRFLPLLITLICDITKLDYFFKNFSSIWLKYNWFKIRVTEIYSHLGTNRRCNIKVKGYKRKQVII